MRVFEKRVLRRVFCPKRDEVTGEWRKLYNEELRDLYSLPNIVRVVKSRRMRWAGHVSRRGRERCAQGRWKDNIRIDLQELGGGGAWIDLAQDRDRWRAIVNTAMNYQDP